MTALRWFGVSALSTESIVALQGEEEDPRETSPSVKLAIFLAASQVEF